MIANLRPLTLREAYRSRPEQLAKLAMEDRQALGCPIYTDFTDALFALADDLTDYYPEESYLN